MKTPSRQAALPFWTDGLFWLALLAAPACWFLMIVLGVAQRSQMLPLTQVLLMALINPILEEIVFRGGLQSWLRQRSLMQYRLLGTISLANLVTSVLFASLHLFRQPPLWAALIIIPSLVFGWAKERHQTLLSPILLHIAYNTGFIWLF